MKLRLPHTLRQAVLTACSLFVPAVFAGTGEVWNANEEQGRGSVSFSPDYQGAVSFVFANDGIQSGAVGKDRAASAERRDSVRRDSCVISSPEYGFDQGDMIGGASLRRVIPATQIKFIEEKTESWTGHINMVGENGEIIAPINVHGDFSSEKEKIIEREDVNGAQSIIVDPGFTLFTGVTTMGSDGLETSTGLEDFKGSITLLDGAVVGSEVVNEDEEEDPWYLSQEDLERSVSEAFDSVVGDSEVNYAYRLLGRMVVSNVSLGPNEYMISGDGSLIEMGKTQPEGHIILDGGTLDVRKLESPFIEGDRISGSRGSLLTEQPQTLRYNSDQKSGYSVYGQNADTGAVEFGANIVIGSEERAAAPYVQFDGRLYATPNISVNNGVLSISDKSIVGLEGRKGTVTVGTANTQAALVNNGVIRNDVLVRTGSVLSGNGRYEASVTVEKGALLFVSSQPASNSVHMLITGAESTTGASDASMVGFFLDGTTRATFDLRGGGTHSYLNVNTLDWAPETRVILEVGSGLLDNKTVGFTIKLLTYDTSAEERMPSGELDGDQISLSGLTNILLTDSIRVYWDDRNLIMSGSMNIDAVTDLLRPDGARIANALWSSTRAVQNFARSAAGQLDAYRAGDSNFWASGLGDFARVSGQGDISGYDYSGGGYAVGADRNFTPHFTAGLSFGQTFGSHKSNDGGMASIDQSGTMGGLYARYRNELDKTHTLTADAYAAYGRVENKGTMALFGNDVLSRDTWEDDVASFGLKLSWQIKLDETSTLTPFAGLEFVHGAQQDINFATLSGNRHYYDGSMQNWSLPVGVTYRKTFDLGGGQLLIPEVTVAYVGDIARRTPGVRTDILGESLRIEGVNPGRSAVRANVGVGWVMSTNWGMGLYYNVESRSGMTNQGVNGTVSYSF